jgi:hypothetical protein
LWSGFFACFFEQRRTLPWNCALDRTAGLDVLLPTLSLAAGKCERLVITGSPDATLLVARPAGSQTPDRRQCRPVAAGGQGAGVKVELLYAGTRAQAWTKCAAGAWTCWPMPRLTRRAGNPRLHSPAVAAKRLSGVDPQGLVTLAYSTAADLHGPQGALSESTLDPGIRTAASN